MVQKAVFYCQRYLFEESIKYTLTDKCYWDWREHLTRNFVLKEFKGIKITKYIAVGPEFLQTTDQ